MFRFTKNAKFVAVVSIGTMLIVNCLQPPYMFPAIFFFNLFATYHLGEVFEEVINEEKEEENEQ